ncbi:CsbD family protein [Mesorhizobium sp. 10J20-29]
MGSTKDKAAGMANAAAGNVKQGVGKAVGNKKLQGEGKAQERKGESQQALGKAKSATKNGL